MNLPYVYALLSATTFAASSVIWRSYQGRLSSYWINAFKNAVSLVGFAFAIAVTTGFNLPSPATVALLSASGILGLTLGDFFLIQSYMTIGPSRTFMISNFQPLFLGILAFIFLGQSLSPLQIGGVLAMMACVLTLALEARARDRKKGLSGLGYAFVFLALDGVGMLVARLAFNQSPGLNAIDANFFRCFAAGFGFLVLSRWRPIHLWGGFQKLPRKDQIIALTSGLLGTFVGLLFRMLAIAHGNLATVIAIAGTAPLIAAGLESFSSKHQPSRYFWVAMGFFTLGLFIIVKSI